MKNPWWTRLIQSVSDRGAGASRPRVGPNALKRLEKNCEALLTSRGAASGVALVKGLARPIAPLLTPDSPEARGSRGRESPRW